RLPQMRAAAMREDEPVGDLAGQPHHALAQRRQDDRRQSAKPVVSPKPRDKIADIGERPTGHDSHAAMARRVRDADPETKAPTGGLGAKGGALRELRDRAARERR